jgi:hypothetical protein
MISKSKLGTIAFIAAIGLASPAFAQYGGGSPGYNAHNTTNYKLKKHHAKQHASAKMQKKKSSQ